jgi:hypothetical protein
LNLLPFCDAIPQNAELASRFKGASDGIGFQGQAFNAFVLSFKRTTCTYKSLSHIWFLRLNRARGLNWSSSVVLHDGWWFVGVYVIV